MVDLIIILKSLIFGYITGLLISMPLGPSAIESVNRTVSRGFKEGFMVSIGAISADMTYLIFINCGLLNLLDRNRNSEPLFWVISGCVLVYTAYIYIVNSDNKLNFYSNFNSSFSFLSGYIITFFNPLTLTLWLGLSGTILRLFHNIGGFYYYSFIFSILCGMITWFFLLNLLALKGFKLLKSNHSNTIAKSIKYCILIIGIIFITLGLQKILLNSIV